MADLINADFYLSKAKELQLEAKRILADENSTADDLDKVDNLKVEIAKYQKRAADLRELDKDIEAKKADEERKAREAEAKRLSDEENRSFKTFGQMLHAINQWETGRKRDERLAYVEGEGLERKDLAEAVGSTGGFLVPLEQSNNMYSLAAPSAMVRPRATIIPMSRRQMNIPVLDQTSTTAGKFHWFGGLEVFWQAEASEKSASEPAFREITLTANELVGYTRASEALLEDEAVGLEALLTGPMGFAGAVSAAEDYAFLNGNGVGQPLGVISATGVTTSIARSVQGSVEYEDLLDMEAAFYSPSNRGVWIISQSQMANVMKMTGPAGNPNYVYRPSAVEGQPGTLLGRPVFFTLDMLPIGSGTSNGDVLLADFSFYLIGDRKRVTVDSTRLERFRNNQVSWRVVTRVDGQPWLSAPITSRDGSTQVSPFVMLGAKST